MRKLKTKNFLVIFVAAALIGLAVALSNQSKKYEKVTSYSDGNYAYRCSQPIEVSYQSIPQGEGGNKKAIPKNAADAKKYCKAVAVF